MSKKAEPLIRIVRRDGIKKIHSILLYIGAVLIALVIGALLLLFLKVEPFSYYKNIFTIGMIGHAYPYMLINNFITSFVPLLITSLALSLAFKMRFWNIGGEGQFIIGALAGAAVAFNLPGGTNPYLSVLLMALAGGVAGGLIGLLTAVLKVKLNTNETLFTLMMNYILLYLLTFFGETMADWNFFVRHSDKYTRAQFNSIPLNTQMPCIVIGSLSINVSFIFSLLLAVFVYLYIKKTKQGYEISVVGDSVNTARYAGMKVGKVICRTMFISAFMIGMAGAFHVSTAHALSTSITGDVGWTGIIVAWISRLNAFAILLVSFLMTILRYGSTAAATQFSNIDSHFADLIQGIVLFVILAADFFIRFKLVINVKSHRSHRNADKDNSGKEAEA